MTTVAERAMVSCIEEVAGSTKPPCLSFPNHVLPAFLGSKG